ncbi:hypothetical protein M8J76_013348 [Diaphorina citri]|nr:hypothetical protein M8J76_013348 [Diaphorina citri]KAI5747658.1 hypothetical protein M8J77_017162 [Diaphorina citri]
MPKSITKEVKRLVDVTEIDLDEDDLDKMNTKEIVKEIYKKMKKYDEMMKTVLENKREIENLKKKLNEKEQENMKLRKSIEKQDENIGELSQRSRMINIVINGVVEKSKENVLEIVTKIGNDIGIEGPENHIQVAHRVPSATSPRPIIVRLLNTKTRDLWTKAARDKKLREKKIFINEHLTTKNYKLLQSVKSWAKGNNYKFVWTRDCRILVRKDDKSKVKCIKSVRDLPNFSVGVDELNARLRFPSGDHSVLSDFE